MEQLHATPFSFLTDEEFHRHLLNKGEPTAEDVEAALRMEMLMDNYSGLLEEIHTAALSGLKGAEAARVLERIVELTAPAR